MPRPIGLVMCTFIGITNANVTNFYANTTNGLRFGFVEFALAFVTFALLLLHGSNRFKNISRTRADRFKGVSLWKQHVRSIDAG